MAHKINRVDFLSGNLRGGPPLRPPWALPEAAFVEACTGCDECRRACPTGILRKGRGRYPLVDFSRGECLLCGDCAAACRNGALVHNRAERPWHLKARIDTSACLAQRGIECRGCEDFCEPRAIRFGYQAGGVAIPKIDSQLCSGCGACFAPCPSGAISLNPEMEAAA